MKRAAGLCLLLMGLAPAAALAQGTNETDPPPAPPGKSLEWSARWPRFRAWEYAGTAAVGLTALYYEGHSHSPEQPHWTGGILFDNTVRGWLRSGSESGRARAQKLSDRLWFGGTAYPFVVDLPVALIVHRRPGVAWQMFMMDLEAYAVTGFVNRFLEFEVGRARPSAPDCASNPGYDGLCGTSSNNAGFPSGHTLGIATAAGLTCVHHRYLPLFGSPVADAAPCALMVAATGMTGVARMVGDRHYASDVLVGAAVGFGVGYTLPWLLHYRYGARDVEHASDSRPVLLPWASADGIGAAVVGSL